MDFVLVAGAGWLETDGLSREDRAVSQGLLLVDKLGLERGLLHIRASQLREPCSSSI